MCQEGPRWPVKVLNTLCLWFGSPFESVLHRNTSRSLKKEENRCAGRGIEIKYKYKYET